MDSAFNGEMYSSPVLERKPLTQKNHFGNRPASTREAFSLLNLKGVCPMIG